MKARITLRPLEPPDDRHAGDAIRDRVMVFDNGEDDMRKSTPTLALTVLVVAVLGTAAKAGTYAVSAGVKGVVDMYDLSSVVRTDRGFTIRYVAVSDHFPTFFGPVAYRVGREDYDCGTGHYVIAELQEFDGDGRLLNRMGRGSEDDMVVVPDTASAEMYDRFCEAGRRGVQVTGLTPKESVDRDTPFAAYTYGKALLISDRH